MPCFCVTCPKACKTRWSATKTSNYRSLSTMIYLYVCGNEVAFMHIAPKALPRKTTWFCIQTRSKKWVQQLPRAERTINQSADHTDISGVLRFSMNYRFHAMKYFFKSDVLFDPHFDWNCNKTRLMACGAASHLQVTVQLEIPEACTVSSNGRNLRNVTFAMCCLHVPGTLEIENSEKPKPANGRTDSAQVF